MVERLLDQKEVSKRILKKTDYQVIREIEKMLPGLKDLLANAGVNVTDIDLTKIDKTDRDNARLRTKR